MRVFSFLEDRRLVFENILVHPSQELLFPTGTIFRGGPEWPRFETQILARHCWGGIPRPIDFKPHPAEPEWPYFDRERVALIGEPTRFARLSVLPQAERRYGGSPSPRHLQLMDSIVAATAPPTRDLATVYVSRSGMGRGNFAGEAYLDRTFAAAGV